jgi:glycerophosphoryl diester phosphodiesterase
VVRFGWMEMASALPPLYAHRLGRHYGPDSSAAALRHTLTGPVEGLETDVCLTADDRLVLLHDPLLTLGTTLDGWARQRTAEEIRSARSSVTPRESRRPSTRSYSRS